MYNYVEEDDDKNIYFPIFLLTDWETPSEDSKLDSFVFFLLSGIVQKT